MTTRPLIASRNKLAMPASLARMTSTVPRCHVIGCVTAVVLILGTAWIWSWNSNHADSIEYEGTVVDLNDAAALLENAEQWRQLYTVNYRQSRVVDDRSQSIASWLPTSVDWTKTENDIRLIADSTGLSILAIQSGDVHVGTRVGVVSSSCEVQGSYQALCRFLHELACRTQPIACSEIRLNRLVGEDDELANGTPSCNVTLSLRIPFAAAGTAAEQLLQPEASDAS